MLFFDLKLFKISEMSIEDLLCKSRLYQYVIRLNMIYVIQSGSKRPIERYI
jgi:hypothetical protein